MIMFDNLIAYHDATWFWKNLWTYQGIATTLQVQSSEAKRNKYISPKKPYTQ